MVQQRGSAVIKARGSSSAASAANAVVDEVVRLTTNTAINDSFSVASVSKGDYQVEPGLVFSFPTRVDNGIISIVQGIDLSHSFSQEKFKLVLDEVRQERDIVKSLGLI
jgi:malate dehydrogenase